MPTEGRGKPDNNTTAAPRKRALVSCDRCKLRRARCIRDRPDEPCADCNSSGVACESKLPRKQRVYGSVETLSVRYRALEALVKGLFPHENTQDVHVLFSIAAARNIAMPAVDDYTPANIFHPVVLDGGMKPRQHPNEPLLHTPPRPRPRRSAEPTAKKRPGHAYDFGPSSSIRFAVTMRMLVARHQAIPGALLPRLPESMASCYDRSREAAKCLPYGSTNPSDEEERPSSSRDRFDPDRTGRKRSRAQMEGTSDRWEHREGSPNPDRIGDLLPSRSLADALVAVYFDHIHLHLPLFHRTMFQFRLEATYSRKTERLKDCADIGWLVALALVFSLGCQRLREHDPRQAHKLRLKFLGFTKSYLRHVLMDSCLINVQVLVLLHLHFHTVGQKSSSWSAIGLAARMAITMSMHRDDSNRELEPIERNTRRQVFWSIYTAEKKLCSILGCPTVIDDAEWYTQMPDAPMLGDGSISPEFMATELELTRMSYRIRQCAYFDRVTKEERSPSLDTATLLLQQCAAFFATIPESLTLDFSPVSPDQRGRILLLHIYYYYTRCIVSRDFLCQKVERNLCYLEAKPPPLNEDWHRTLLMSEDCVDSAHQMLNCILAGAHLGMIGYSWLDLFFVSYSILIVCADFLARPQQQVDSAGREKERGGVRGARLYARRDETSTDVYDGNADGRAIRCNNRGRQRRVVRNTAVPSWRKRGYA